jgi:threonine/homoserine/homoserine lactone efflux protein
MAIVNGVLSLIAWGVVCLLVVVLYRIARFYRSPGRAHFIGGLVPLVLLAAAARSMCSQRAVA